MGKHLSLTAADQHKLGAYRADPQGTPKGGLVVVQEIFGVHEHIADVVRRFARPLARFRRYIHADVNPFFSTDAVAVLDEGEDAVDRSMGELKDFYQAARKKFDEEPAFADRARQRVVLGHEAHALLALAQL